MISMKELKIVSDDSIKMPYYPGKDTAEKALEKLDESIQNYLDFYANKQYEIILSNGKRFNFQIFEKNLCHMFGIDFSNLLSDYFAYWREKILKIQPDTRITSFQLLKAILANRDEVIGFDCMKNGYALNYYSIMVKCAIFEKLFDFSEFNFGVINFNSARFFKKQNIEVNRSYADGIKYYLYVESGEETAPYFMMGIGQDSSRIQEPGNELYVPFSLRAPGKDKIEYYFDQQSVAIPTQIYIDQPGRMFKFEATPNEKLALINQYKKLMQELGLPGYLNINSDYSNVLRQLDAATRADRARRRILSPDSNGTQY